MEDFKALWREQNIISPDISELKSRLSAYKKANIASIIKTNVMLLATSIFIMFIWHWCQPEFLTTKIGIVLVIATIVLYLIVYTKLLVEPNRNTDQTNAGYLENLIAIKNRQRFLQTTMMKIYYSMLSVGLMLYMYEYALRMTLLLGIIVYAVSFLWIAIAFLYIRPRTIKKEQQKIDELIDKFTEINQQLKQQ